ncbi:hypothetical protein D3C81_1373670 [compost metagenome]
MFLGYGQLFAIAERSDQDPVPGFFFDGAGLHLDRLAEEDDLRTDLVGIGLLAERAGLQEELGGCRWLDHRWCRWWRLPHQRRLSPCGIDLRRFRWGNRRLRRYRRGLLRYRFRRHDHFRLGQQGIEIILWLDRLLRARRSLVGFGGLLGFLLLRLAALDFFVARLELHQKNDEGADGQADRQPQPARNRLLCRGLVATGAALGGGFFLGSQLTYAPGFPGRAVPDLA